MKIGPSPDSSSGTQHKPSSLMQSHILTKYQNLNLLKETINGYSTNRSYRAQKIFY